MSHTTLSNATITQTKQAYADTTNYNANLNKPIIAKTTGDLITENKCQLLYIIVIAGMTYSILRNNQPDLDVYMED